MQQVETLMPSLTDPASGIGIETCVKSGTACLLVAMSLRLNSLNWVPFVNDPEALKDARPDIKENLDVYVGIPLVEEPQPRPTRVFGFVGDVTVVIS